MKIETFGRLNIDEAVDIAYAFIYMVIEKSTKKGYVGRKEFKTRKGEESDWRTYRTSNKYLKTAIKNNPEDYEFRLLGFTNDETATKLAEAEMILKWDTLDPELGYNANVILNIRRSVPELPKRKLMFH